MADFGRLLITGASGFLGARTTELLLDRGYEIAVLLRQPESAWRLEKCVRRLHIIKGDLEDRQSYQKAVQSYKPDALLHMGWSGVGGADRNNASQARNIAAATDLLDLALEAGTRHFIGLGSQAEYGPLNRKLDETAAEAPTTLYGHAKLATGKLTGFLCEQAKARFVWARVFSTYGPRDNPNWLIPSLIEKLASGETMSLTAGEQFWDFLFIDDAAKAFAALLETHEAKGVFNLGSGDAPPLRETILQLRELVRPGAELGFGVVPYRPDQVMHLEADRTRLSSTTGWKPETGLSEGLRETVNWFQSSASSKLRHENHA